jgi:hypothetical protein
VKAKTSKQKLNSKKVLKTKERNTRLSMKKVKARVSPVVQVNNKVVNSKSKKTRNQGKPVEKKVESGAGKKRSEVKKEGKSKTGEKKH